jgi:hypothetical protein
MATRRTRNRTTPLQRAVGNVPELPENPLCQDPCEIAWEALLAHFFELQKEFEGNDDAILATECRAAISVSRRVLECQASSVEALAAVRAVFNKISTVLAYSKRYAPYKSRLEGLQGRLEDLCRLIPCTKCQKPAGECACGSSDICACTDNQDSGFTQYGQWLEVERSGRLLEDGVMHFEKVLLEVEPHLPYGHKVTEHHRKMKGSISVFSELLREARTAVVACDPKAVDDVLLRLYDRAAAVAYAYDQLVCQLGLISCTMQAAFFSMLQAEVDGIGLIAATLMRAVNKLGAPCQTAGDELRKVWQEMRTYVNTVLRDAFCRYEERQLCPPEKCYERATSDLRKIIDRGLMECEGLAIDAYGCDQTRFARQRELVDLAVCEIVKLDCRSLEGFDPCIWTRLGFYTMRLYAILGRTTNIVADQIRTLAESFRHLKEWFNHMDQEPPQDVVPYLRAFLAIVRSLEDRARGYGVCAQVPTGPCADYGQMQLHIVDDNGLPMGGCKVVVRSQAAGGPSFEGITDSNGNYYRDVPRGSYAAEAGGTVITVAV